ncbi:MAG: hypothetical protein P1Q69_03270 [Candidatus Thorarchaeota archaeon]|nr:hypothetical protein [Candidatus Thorarchaeota archaeon]
MKLVTINVGLSGIGRGFVFPDRSFVYIPLDAPNSRCKKLPKYNTLYLKDYSKSQFADSENLAGSTLGNLIPELKQEKVHNDPDFEDKTYGHAKRGFGYEKLLGSMVQGDILLFLATLDYMPVRGEKRVKSINPEWGAYLVGSFNIENVFSHEHFNCLSVSKQKRFRNNPHYYCKTGADMWISGKQNKLGLFRKAVPLSTSDSSIECIPFLRKNFESSGGKPAGSAGWYRAAFVCRKNSKRVWKRIVSLGNLHIYSEL